MKSCSWTLCLTFPKSHASQMNTEGWQTPSAGFDAIPSFGDLLHSRLPCFPHSLPAPAHTFQLPRRAPLLIRTPKSKVGLCIPPIYLFTMLSISEDLEKCCCLPNGNSGIICQGPPGKARGSSWRPRHCPRMKQSPPLHGPSTWKSAPE